MEEYYNSVENIGLSMSGLMIFFFGEIYIQFHINRIARGKNWENSPRRLEDHEPLKSDIPCL